MTNQERLQLIKANEERINELRMKRSETMGQILKLYEMKIKENERGNK